jgi:uncharacterized NAD(P)/FAD-binding protein YdhS
MESLNAGTSVPENEILEKQRRQEVSDLLDQVFEGIPYYNPHTLITIEPEKQSTIEEAAEAVISLRGKNSKMLEEIKSDSRFETPESTQKSEASIMDNFRAQTVFIRALMTESERRKEESRIQKLSDDQRKKRVEELIRRIVSQHTSHTGSNAS